MDQKHYNMMNWEEVEAVTYADCDNPFSILGVHKKGKNNLIQIYYPQADEIEVTFITEGKSRNLKLEKVDEIGFFAEFFSFEFSSYSYSVKIQDKIIENVYDPYSFKLALDSNEIKNFVKGKSVNAHKVLGCHKKEINGVKGYEFVVYAPNASCVSLVGDFNDWNESADIMQRDKKNSDVFWLFMPELKDYSQYKYLIKSRGFKEYKIDMFAFGTKDSNSLTVDCDNNKIPKKSTNYNLQILEVDLFEMFNKFKDINSVLKTIEDNLSDNCYNTVLFKSFLAKANGNNVNLFSFDLSLCSYEDLLYIVNEIKKKKFSVIYENPIALFSNIKDGIRQFDSSFLFENDDYRMNYHKYYDALLLDYNKDIVKSYVLSSAEYLLSTFPFDGILFSDLGVTLYHDYNKKPGEYITEEWNNTINLAGVKLLIKLNDFIHASYEGSISLAGIYAYYENVTGKDDGSLGFDYCLNTGACNQILDFFAGDYSKRNNNLDSFLLFTHFINSEEKYIYPFSYKEANRISSLAQNDDNLYGMSNLKISYIYKHLIEGSQLSDISTETFLWEDSDLQKCYSKFLNDFRKTYTEKSSLLKNFDENKIFSYKCIENQVITREYLDSKEDYIIVFNFSKDSFPEYKINVSKKGVYTECFNSDLKKYGGTGLQNRNPVATLDNEDEGILSIKLPAFSALAFSYRDFTKEELEEIYQKKKAAMIAYVDSEKKKIQKQLDIDISELKKNADSKIKELEKMLKPYDR